VIFLCVVLCVLWLKNLRKKKLIKVGGHQEPNISYAPTPPKSGRIRVVWSGWHQGGLLSTKVDKERSGSGGQWNTLEDF